ncbi:MAG TPA: hemerythrin domain-containing protein [Acidimicrobiales bacterium]|nr:hemerythrin domain-containing protein [Acidimicrobiales bacterium]
MSASDSATQPDAIEVLTADHSEVEVMFGQLETLPEGTAKDEVVDGVVRELSVHAAIEEQILYPVMRKALPDGETLVQEAIDEHQEVKETLAAIEKAGSPAERAPLLQRLIADVRHHVDEEEVELFPKLAASIGKTELREMGGKLQSAKKAAPTHPHPHAPNTPPGNVVAGAAAAVIDKARDALKRD